MTSNDQPTPYMCPECGASFGSPAAGDEHLVREHGYPAGPMPLRNPHLETLDCLDARMVELDLMEQAINAGRDMTVYKLQRLEDLQRRRKALLAATPEHGEELQRLTKFVSTLSPWNVQRGEEAVAEYVRQAEQRLLVTLEQSIDQLPGKFMGDDGVMHDTEPSHGYLTRARVQAVIQDELNRRLQEGGDATARSAA